MQLSLQNFPTLVGNMIAAATGACSALLDATVGSVLRALLESSASVALWLQWQALQVLSMTRLASSSGADVDSWIADFGMTRLPGNAAIGPVQLASLSPTQSGTVPVGTIVKSADATLSFAVTQNTGNPAWSTSAGAYVRQAGQASISVPVQCQVVGAIGNVTAGTVSLLAQPLAGFDTCTNLNAMTGGSDAETDSAVQARFVVFFNTRSQGTQAAVVGAVGSVQTGLTTIIREGVDSAGVTFYGHFVVVVDDGSGAPPASLLAAIYAAVDAVRPIGSTFEVVAPLVLTANVSMSLTVNSSITLAAADTAVNAAIVSFINALPVGSVLSYAQLAGLPFSVPGVTNVANALLNGGTADLGGISGQVVRAGSVVIA